MGKLHKKYLNDSKVYVCRICKTHLSKAEDIISKNFQGRSGKAYLFDSAINVKLGPSEERILMTGLHTVADMYCNSCYHAVGWKYEEAHEESQKYKEGKFIIEVAKTSKEFDLDKTRMH